MRVNFSIYFMCSILSIVSFAAPEEQGKERKSKRLAIKQSAKELAAEKSELERKIPVLKYENTLLQEEIVKIQDNYKFLIYKLNLLKELNECTEASAEVSGRAHDDDGDYHDGGGAATATAAPDEDTEDDDQFGRDEVDVSTFENSNLASLSLLRNTFIQLSISAVRSRFELQKLQSETEELERQIQAITELLILDSSDREESAY